MDKSLLSVAHATIKDLHKAGVVNKMTMRQFNALCLPLKKSLTYPQGTPILALKSVFDFGA